MINSEIARMVDYIRTVQRRFKSFDTFYEFEKILDSLGVPTTRKGFISQSKNLSNEQIKAISMAYQAIAGSGGTKNIEKHFEDKKTIKDLMDDGRKTMYELYKDKNFRHLYIEQKRLRKSTLTLLRKSNGIDISKISDDFLDLYALTIGKKFEEKKKEKEEYACDEIIAEIEDELQDLFSSEEEQVLLQSDYLTNVYDYLTEEENIKRYSSYDF